MYVFVFFPQNEQNQCARITRNIEKTRPGLINTGERHLATQRNNKRNQGTLLRTFDQPRATDSRTHMHVDVPRSCSVSLFQNRMRGAESARNSWNSSKTNGPRVRVCWCEAFEIFMMAERSLPCLCTCGASLVFGLRKKSFAYQ